MSSPMQDAPRILVAQIGARRRYAVPLAFHRSGMLGLLVTDIAAHDFVGRLARAASSVWKNRFVRKLGEREIPEIPVEKIRTFPWFGLRRRLVPLLFRSGSIRLRHARDNQRFGELACQLPLSNYDAVYVFNGAGLEIARLAKEVGIKVILDQTSAPIRVEEQLLAEERARWPGWEVETQVQYGYEELAEREEEEWKLADLIICGSEYVKNCLVHLGIHTSKLAVVPTGVQLRETTPSQRERSLQLTRILWGGTVCLQKGAPYFAEAARKLRNHLSFVAFGECSLTVHGRNYFSQSVNYQGSVPHSWLLKEYQRADVFVLPSISEGSALVCYEALAAGLPVITTPNSGSVVRDGVEGLIVPIRSSEAIVQALERLMRDRQCLGYMRQAAIERAAEFTWENYWTRLDSTVRAALG